MDGSKLRFRMGLIGLFALAALGIAVLMAVMPAGAYTTGDAYPGYGDWVVDNPTQVIDEVVVVYGDVVVNSKLELWNATVLMDLGYDDQYMIEVATSGELKANDTLITSTNTAREYGFEVYGKMTLLRTAVEETYNGLRILTDDTVLLQDSWFTRSYGTGLYLEDADGTTLRNIQIQTNEISVSTTFSARSDSSSDYRQTHVVAGTGGAMYIKGGNPTIEGVYVSANGTQYVTVNMAKYGYYYFYMYLHVYFPLVGIDSDEMSSVSGIHVRDSKINIEVTYNCRDYWTYPYAYWYLYTYGYSTAVNVLNYGDVELKGCTATNVEVDRVTARATGSGSATYHYTYTYTYNQGMTLFGATVNKVFNKAGPHTFKMTLRDAQFEDVGVLTTAFTPGYNGTVDPTFYSYINIDNVSVNKGKTPFNFAIGPTFSGMKTIHSRIVISNGTYTNMSSYLYQNSVGAGPGVNSNVRTFEVHDTVRVENCVLRWANVGYNGMFYEPYEYKNEFNNEYDRHIEIVGCKILDNKGALFYIQGNYYKNRGLEHFLLQDCLIQNNSGSEMGYLTYKERISFIDNEFIDNQWNYELYSYEYGGDQNGKQPAIYNFTGNKFIDTYTTGGGKTNGMLYIDYGGTLIIDDNYLEGLESAFMTVYPYAYYSGFADMYMRGNEWTQCNGTLLYFQLYYGGDFTGWIEDNYGHDTNGWITDYYTYYAENYENDGTFYFRNNTMTGFTGSVFRMYGKLTITGNTFRDCVGYVIEIDYLSANTPVIHSNNIVNCENVYLIGAKDKGALKMSLSVSDLNVDCTGNAFYFKRVDATMTNVQITNRASVAIIAEDSTVDAMGSSIPVGSGQIIGSGEINVWFGFELWVEWSNEENPDVSSGVPIEEALVVLYGASKAYYSSTYTDADGHVKATNIPQWTLKGSFLTVWSPFTVSLSKAGVTNKTEIVLDKDFTGPDAIHMLLSDTYLPDIRITSPFSGDVFNTDNVTVRGFSTEIGSGLGSIWLSVGDGDWMEVEFDENGDFMYTLTDLPEGVDVPVRAKVYDIARNVMETVVTVTIDRTPPRLVILEPEDDIVTNEADIIIRGEYEPGASITINGLRREGTSGTLSEPYTLSEGRNTIVVMATDPAGNSATETRTLRLDRFSPTLTVLAPRDGLVTRVTNISIEGDAELGSSVTVSVYRSGTDTIDEVITLRPDGTFLHKVDLEEGENVVVVTAEDTAMNLAQITRVVHVDTTAPLCMISSPSDGMVTNENTVLVVGTAEVEGITLFLNGKQIFNDGMVERYVNLNEGANVITLRAVDVIGNVYEDKVTVHLDTMAPVIVPIRPRSQHLMTNTATLVVQATVTENRDLDTITVMGSDVSWSPVTGQENTYQFETTVTLPKEGTNEVLVVARDEAGNVATHTVTVEYSTVRPMLFLVFSPSGSNIEGDNPNFYISGTTNVGIEEVTVTHTVAGDTVSTTAPVAEDGTFSVVRTLLEGTNSFTVSTTDAYGNTNTTADYSVTYKYRSRDGGVEEPSELTPETWAVWILVIAVALFITAVVVTRMLRREEQ